MFYIRDHDFFIHDLVCRIVLQDHEGRWFCATAVLNEECPDDVYTQIRFYSISPFMDADLLVWIEDMDEWPKKRIHSVPPWIRIVVSALFDAYNIS